MPDAMNAPVQNPHIVYQSEPLPEHMRDRLHKLRYAPHAAGLLMQGLPITYSRDGKQIVEYPDGRRIEVESRNIYDEDGVFIRYHFDILGELEPARR